MQQPPAQSIRGALLAVIPDRAPNQEDTLRAAADKLNVQFPEEAILTQWHELFRTGLLAWGINLANPDPPWYHLTARGLQALAHATRDPSNPAGYLQHLSTVATLNDVAKSYLVEGLDCYVAGLFKSSAVMVGASAESMILELRDQTVQKLTTLGRSAPAPMNDWRVKTVSDALNTFIDTNRAQLDRSLREAFDAYWPAFASQLRTTRNDAGHPTSIDPITPDTAHAGLLVFPEFARLANALVDWITNTYA